MAKSINLLLFMVATLAIQVDAHSATIRCGNKLVTTGDTKAEVIIKCGAPAWKDNWSDLVINNANAVDEFRVSVDRERWVYNFGPNSFLRFLLFENGRLIDISTGDYGFDERHPAIKSCTGDEIATGSTQYEVLQRCGEPFFKDTRNEETLSSVDEHTARLVVKRVDEWTYNFGPNRFLRIFHFENGVLVKVETGDRGF